MCLNLSIADLTHSYRHHRSDHLWLAVGNRAHDRCCYNVGTDDLSHTTGTAGTGGGTAGHGFENDGVTLRGPVAVIQVPKVARLALPKLSRVSKSHQAIGAEGEASRVQCTGLRRLVELELVVGRDVSGTRKSIFGD